MPLLQLTADGVRNGGQFGRSVLVFENWDIIGDPYSNMGSERIIQNSRQAMVVIVIGLINFVHSRKDHGYRRNMEE